MVEINHTSKTLGKLERVPPPSKLESGIDLGDNPYIVDLFMLESNYNVCIRPEGIFIPEIAKTILDELADATTETSKNENYIGPEKYKFLSTDPATIRNSLIKFDPTRKPSPPNTDHYIFDSCELPMG